MKSITTLLQGMLLGAGMLLYVGLATGMYMYLRTPGAGYAALVIWMTALVLIGFALRRWKWPQRSHAWKVTAVALAIFVSIQILFPLLIDGRNPFVGGVMEFSRGIGVMMWLFLPWFWLPFAIGILAGGFRRKASAHSGKHPTIA